MWAIILVSVLVVMVLIPVLAHIYLKSRWNLLIADMEASPSKWIRFWGQVLRTLSPGNGKEAGFPYKLMFGLLLFFVLPIVLVAVFVIPLVSLGILLVGAGGFFAVRHFRQDVEPDFPEGRAGEVMRALYTNTVSNTRFEDENWLEELHLPPDTPWDARARYNGIEIDIQTGQYLASTELDSFKEKVETHPLVRGYHSAAEWASPVPSWVRIQIALQPMPRGVKTGAHIIENFGEQTPVAPLDKPRVAYAGVDSFGREVLLDLNVGKNGMVAGSQGTGKSQWLQALATQYLAKWNPFAEDWYWDLVVLALKDEADFMPLKPWAKTYVGQDDSLTKQVNALEHVEEFRKLRQQEIRAMGYRSIDEIPPKQQPRRVFVIVDESRLLTGAAPEAQEVLYLSTKQGRSAGIHYILSEQMPKTEGLGKSKGASIYGNCPIRISFGHLPQGVKGVQHDGYESFNTEGVKGNIPGRGLGQLMSRGRETPVVFQGAYASDSTITEFLQERRPI